MAEDRDGGGQSKVDHRSLKLGIKLNPFAHMGEYLYKDRKVIISENVREHEIRWMKYAALFSWCEKWLGILASLYEIFVHTGKTLDELYNPGNREGNYRIYPETDNCIIILAR